MLLTLELIKSHAGVPLTREYLIREGLVKDHRSAARTQETLVSKQDKYNIDTSETFVITVGEAFKGSIPEMFIELHDPKNHSAEALAERWGCDKTRVYPWLWGSSRDEMVRLLLRGLTFKECTDVVTDLSEVCHSRGFSIKELSRAAGISVNGIKGWAKCDKRIGRFWDLVRGYEYAVIAR